MGIENILTLSGIILTVIGFISLISGLIVLMRKTLSNEVAEVTKEVTKMVKKGLLSDAGSAMENASFLIKEMTNMIQTTRGIGVVLVFFGAAIIAGGIAVLYRLK